jgi:hypothetical protein
MLRTQTNAAEAVIASEAKQSMAPRNRKLDCFIASLFAMTGQSTQ